MGIQLDAKEEPNGDICWKCFVIQNQFLCRFDAKKILAFRTPWENSTHQVTQQKVLNLNTWAGCELVIKNTETNCKHIHSPGQQPLIWIRNTAHCTFTPQNYVHIPSVAAQTGQLLHSKHKLKQVQLLAEAVRFLTAYNYGPCLQNPSEFQIFNISATIAQIFTYQPSRYLFSI